MRGAAFVYTLRMLPPRNSRAPAALLLLLFVVSAGCPGDPGIDRLDLWRDEAEWVATGDGWARAVPLTEPRSVRAEPGVELFRAVALPASPGAGATLRFETPGGIVEHPVSGPTPVAVAVGDGGAMLDADGGVHLLRPRLVRRGRAGETVVLVVGDTLRYDHVDRERMPRLLDRFAGGSRYLQAHTPAPWTLPAVASIFTGELPARLRSPDGTLISLGPRPPTLAGELADRGYVTVGVNANYTVNHENGFSRGFDLYLAPPPREHHPGDFPDARWVVERALEAASWFAGEDLFLYLQLMEPHEPYRHHGTGRRYHAFDRGVEPSPAQLASVREAYASEVAYLDRQLDAFFRGVGETRLEVFTADHGEELYDHGGFRHGPTLYEEVVRVPLLVRGEGVREGIVEHPVSLVALRDLFLGDAGPVLPPPPAVTMETFSFGPPRWSAVLDRRRVIHFASDLFPAPAEHPTARWLRAHHPRISVTDLDNGTPADAGEELVRRSIRRLIDHFAGFRRGLYFLVRGGGELRLRVTGAGRDGVAWGEAAALEVVETGAGELTVEVAEADPFVLLFLPALGDAPPELRDPESGDPIPPGRLGDRVTLWFDPGRPEEVLRDNEETLRRLRALGYI